ncbi:MAG: FtsW/RodA/SpoVE family cell cycle protein, partial [Acholeplasmataceae bacterium]|nr:FtsW/RodA/SpoVE family cell cycle protein [Acholeplasmataceae bacterium]
MHVAVEMNDKEYVQSLIDKGADVNAKDKFGQFLAFAISLSFVIYAFINAAVASGLIPTTGLPLPFISYGGTSLTIICISMGILVNIGLSNAS